MSGVVSRRRALFATLGALGSAQLLAACEAVSAVGSAAKVPKPDAAVKQAQAALKPDAALKQLQSAVKATVPPIKPSNANTGAAPTKPLGTAVAKPATDGAAAAGAGPAVGAAAGAAPPNAPIAFEATPVPVLKPGATPVVYGPMPPMPAGSFMRAIQDRGRLIAGVKGDVKFFGWVNPRSGELEGFDIEIAREITRAIFGDATKVEFRQVTSAQRIPQLREGAVDIIAATLTITRARLDEIDFSDVYYEAQQLLLVPKSSPVTSINDLANRRVCAAKGSTSERNIAKAEPLAQVLQVDTYPECMLAVQQGRADAVSTDDVILSSLADLDPNMHIVGQKIADEPYGLGIAKGKAGFLPFVNEVMAKLRTTGRWKEIHKQWFGEFVETPEPPTRTAEQAAG
jgi:polar amino acid transport system substrate-binding protein